MKMRTITKITASMIGCLLAFAAQPARADSISFSLVTGNSALTPYPGPYGSVLVNLTDSTHATVTFTANTGFLFGDGGTAGVNVNAASWTVGSITGSGLGPLSDAGAGNEDGFKSFNQTID